jgi:hypothetical protein
MLNPFFSKAGILKIEPIMIQSINKILSKIEELGEKRESTSTTHFAGLLPISSLITLSP